MICAMYLRKSRADLTAEARGEGETLARHRETLMRVAVQQNLIVTDVYAEVVSGDTIAERPEMQRLLRAIERGDYDAVLCMDIDRLGRGDGGDQSIILKALKYSGTIVITPYKNYDTRREMDEEFFEYSQFLARGEYKRIKRRMWAGRVAAAKEGKWLSPKAPFGYRRVRLEHTKGWTLVPDPAEADAVRSMFEWYGSGEVGKNIIANRINAMGFRTLSGVNFTSSTIANILNNPVYLGKIRWCNRRKRVDMVNGVEVVTRPRSEECMITEGLHPALIDNVAWDAVQARLATHQDSHVKKSANIVNPLASIMVCGICGKSMLFTPEYTRNDIVATYRCRTAGCPTSGINVQCVYDALLYTLKCWSAYAKEDEPSASKPPKNQSAIVAATTQLAQLNKQLTRLQDLLETGIYSAETYLARSKVLNDRINDTISEIDRLKQLQATDERAAIIRLKPKIDHVLDVWEISTAEDQNTLLRQVLRKVVYHKTHRCFRNDNPADFLSLDFFPVLE